jgi:hypothetical protein
MNTSSSWIFHWTAFPSLQSKIMQLGIAVLLSLAGAGAFVISGCEGADTREAVDDTVEEVTGYKTYKQGEELKKKINEIEGIQAQRLKELEDDSE